MYTDDEGARLLVDELGLAFEHVSTCLNSLSGHRTAWWALGKVLTFSLQEEPFVHIDSDVYLWSALPERILHADVFAQNPEAFYSSEDFYYRPDLVIESVRAVDGWIPLEMADYVPREGVPRAACCGIIGGRRVDFLRHYAKQAIRMLDHTGNRDAWPLLRESFDPKSLECLNVIFEQHLLLACLDYHCCRAGSPYRGIRIEYLFRSLGDACERAAAEGFTHLMGAKTDAQLLARLENRVRIEYPAYYERCFRYSEKSKRY